MPFATVVWGIALRIIGFFLPSRDGVVSVSCLGGCVSSRADRYSEKTRQITENSGELLMVGNTSETWLIENIVRKVCRTESDADATKANVEAAKNEANVYLTLGDHPLFAKCLSIGPKKEYIELMFYPRGTLRDYIYSSRSDIISSQLKTWARQLVQSVAYIHSKGVRHADLRLDQWLLDQDLQPHLADFNGSRYDSQLALGLAFTPATGMESVPYCLPRDFNQDSTVKSDLFALRAFLVSAPD